MTKFEYWWKKIDCSRYGGYRLNNLFDDEIVDEGWEFVSIIDGDVALFKRVADSDAEYTLSNIECELENINNKLNEVISSNVVLVGLVQALVERFCPDSQFLLSLKSSMKLTNNSLENNIPIVNSQDVEEKKTVTNYDSDIKLTKEKCNITVNQEPFAEDNTISNLANKHNKSSLYF
jgi:hypothetical protein